MYCVDFSLANIDIFKNKREIRLNLKLLIVVRRKVYCLLKTICTSEHRNLKYTDE